MASTSGGVGVKVGPAQGYASRASAQLPGCPEVVRFLERWREAERISLS